MRHGNFHFLNTLRWWWHSRTNCPEMLQNHQPWRYSEPDWTQPSVTLFVKPTLSRAVGPQCSISLSILILWRLLIRCTTFPGRNCNTGKINGYLNALLHRTVIVKKFRNSCENTVAIINFFLNSAFPVLCHLCLSWKVLPRFFTFDYNFTTNSFSVGIPSVKEGMITSTCVNWLSPWLC